MRVSELAETGRRDHPVLGSSSRGDTFGCFDLRGLTIIASDGGEWMFAPPAWEHVSVSRRDRTPSWEEMCFVKQQFWLPEDCVVQFHPPQSEYVNCHPRCLHLWKPLGVAIPLPPSETVGPKGVVL